MKFDPSGDLKYQLTRLLNGGLRFGEHIEGGFFELTFSGSIVELAHGLGHTPTGFIVISKDGPGDIWATQQDQWSKTNLFLASNATSLTARLFVM